MALRKVKGQRIETKTLRTKLQRNRFDFLATNELFSDIALFFLMVIAEDPLGVDSDDFKRYYEPRFFGDQPTETFPFDCPQVFRRAALSKAVGIYKSWRSNKLNWDKREAKRLAKLGSKRGKPMKKHKPPVLPTELRLNASLYAGMFKEDTGSSILLRLWTGKSWAWVKFYYDSSPRQAEWSLGTPALVVKRDGTVWLNWVYERYLPATGGIKTLMQYGNRFVAVDTDLDGEICKAAAYDVDVAGEVREIARMTVKGHQAHTARRKSRLGEIAQLMHKTGLVKKGFAYKRWNKIKRCEQDAARQIARQIVDFALKHGCAVIVFEFLGKLRPQKGRYSRRSNQKRAYWLKSTVQEQVARVARQEHNILIALVNPRDTSNTEALSGEKVMRVNEMPTARQLQSERTWDEFAQTEGYHPGNKRGNSFGQDHQRWIECVSQDCVKVRGTLHLKSPLSNRWVRGSCISTSAQRQCGFAVISYSTTLKM